MLPYYEGHGITLYHGDCLSVLTEINLEGIDLIVTDPPYGIGWWRPANKQRNDKGHTGIQGDQDTSARDTALALFPGIPAIVFGSFYAPFPAHLKQVLVWRKAESHGVVGSTTGYRRDCEPVFLCGPWPTRTFAWSSLLTQNGGHIAETAATGHPHTKPLDLIKTLILRSGATLILDPFAGSGTTLRAAKDVGVRAIGIELEEPYCRVAVSRLQQEVLALET